jgi:hypothetical protein
VLALAASAPVGEALVSVFGTSLFGTRTLAVSWPGFALVLAALLVAPGRRVRRVTAVLGVVAFAIGAVRMLEPRFERPDYEGVAAFIGQRAHDGDVVLEGAGLSPGPLTGLDVALRRPLRVLRIGQPQERDHPFGVFDAVAAIPRVARRAAALASGRPLFIVSDAHPNADLDQVLRSLPSGFRRRERRSYPGIIPLVVLVYARDPSSRG